MANNLIPEYLDINYNTIIDSIKDNLADSEIFKDYNYEGSNIAVLIELMAYIGELNTYFLNKIAKNVFIETVDIYENANRIARQEGYEAKGYISSKTVLSVDISKDDGEDGYNFVNYDTLYIPAWHSIASTKQYENSTINFVTTSTQTVVASGSTVSIEIPVVQGDVVNLKYTGKDLIDYVITLPDYKYAFDDDLDDTINTVAVSINGILWSRISDWYDEIGALADEDNVYMIRYNKYKRVLLVFNPSRNVPIESDEIEIIMIKSLRVNGNVSANSITLPNDNFIKNITEES